MGILPVESLCEIYVRSRIRNRRVVQKLQRGVKVTDRHSRWIETGTVNLAKFTLIPPWHIFECVNFEIKQWNVRVSRLCVLGGGL